MPRIPQPKKYKHWCFTINNPEHEIVYKPLSMQYLVVGLEEAGTGTEHLQCYVCFNTKLRRTQVSKIFSRAHLEPMNGTPKQASVYCKKDGVYTEYGILPKSPKQGARLNLQKKWDQAFLNAKQGNFDAIPKYMLIRFYAAFKRIAQDNPVIPADLEHKDNYWIVAPTGFGKSTYAREKWPNFYDKGPNKWWVGYKDQETVLCDDFGPDQCKFLHWYMKRWADNFAFPMETKGGGHMIRPKHIIVTTQYSIEECFEDQLVADAIRNRFNVVQLSSWQQRARDRDDAMELLRAEEELNADGANDPTEDTESCNESEEESAEGFRLRMEVEASDSEETEVIDLFDEPVDPMVIDLTVDTPRKRGGERFSLTQNIKKVQGDFIINH